MKALEVEHAENAKDVVLTGPIFGSQNPDLSEPPKALGAGNGGLGRPNGEENTVLLNAQQVEVNKAIIRPQKVPQVRKSPPAERLSQLGVAVIGLRAKRVWLIVGLLTHLGKGLRRRCVQQSMFQSRWPVMRSPHFASHSWAPFSCLIPHNPLCQWVL